MLLLTLLFSLFSGTALGQEIDYVQSLLTLLNRSGLPPVSCSTAQQGGVCSAAQVCAEYAQNNDANYIIENEQGERFANPVQVALANQVLQCGLKGNLRAGEALDPLGFERWLVQQPDKLQADFNRIMLRISDVAMTPDRTGFRLRPGENHASFITREAMSASTAAGVTMSPALSEALRRWGQQVDARGSQRPEIDWNRVPDNVRELMTDPFTNPSIMQDTSLVGAQARTRYNQRFEWIEGFVEDVRGDILSLIIDQRQRYPDRSPLLENMAVRIRNVGIQVVAQDQIATLCPGPNAFYSPGVHTMFICPQLMNIPADGLRMIIAHELAHAIDPCFAASPLYEINAGPETSFSALNWQSAVAASTPAHSTRVVSDGVGFDANPFTEVLSCLESPQSLNARTADVEGMVRVFRESARNSTDLGHSVSNLDEMEAQMRPDLMRYRGCSNLPGNSRQGEGFSDWVAAEVLAMSSAPVSLTSFGVIMATQCPRMIPFHASAIAQQLSANHCSPQNGIAPSALYTTDYMQIGEMFKMLMQEDAEVHSHMTDRINRLMAVQPALRRRLGCAEEPTTGARYCAP